MLKPAKPLPPAPTHDAASPPHRRSGQEQVWSGDASNVDVESADVEYAHVHDGTQQIPNESPAQMRQRLKSLSAELSALVEARAQQKFSVRRARKRKFCRPSFGVLVWVLFTTLTALWIIDRFTWQINPRQLYSIGSAADGRGRVAGDPTDIKDGPFSVAFYDVFARFSGRLLTMSVDVLYMTKMRSTLHALAESPSVNAYVNMANAFGSMQYMHNVWGIVTAVCTLLHVWSILFPVAVDGYTLEVKSGSFEWPLSERKPTGFKDISGPETRRVMLQVDDVWRLFLMTILFAVLTPLAYKWLKTKYHIGMHLHNFVAVMYVIDIVRRHTHPHNWFINPPVIFLWLVDRFIFGHWWRCQTPKVHRIQLSDDYMLLCWNQRRTLETVSPEFYLRLVDSGFMERAHVVSGFQRKLQTLQLPGVPTDSIGHHWTSAVIMRVYHKKRTPSVPKADKVSHTHRIAHKAGANPLYVWCVAGARRLAAHARAHTRPIPPPWAHAHSSQSTARCVCVSLAFSVHSGDRLRPT